MNPSKPNPIPWLISSDEPWTRYRTRIDILGMDEDHPEVVQERLDMLEHPLVKGLIEKCSTWPGYSLKRHNDANHPIHGLSVLGDFGIRATDPGMDKIVKNVLAHQSPDGAYETRIQLYKRFGGMEGEYWTWMACDATVLLNCLLSFGLGNNTQVQRATSHVLSLVEENGWRCSISELLGNFRGPGKREDPCPITNVYALKALSLVPDLKSDSRINNSIETLLHHWEIRGEKKFYLFGIGTDFRKLKYPQIWYDLLHVSEVLSRYPTTHSDPRYQELLMALTDQVDETGKYTSSSMYRAWKEWSFADKKNPSPWLTFLVTRIQKRSGILESQ